ncbi:MAG: hypothetical protein AAFP98_01675 [Pseudomonadota bacterium]
MNFLIRFSAYATSALAGAAIPLMATADAVPTEASPFLAYHTSSRAAEVNFDMPQAELDALRAQIWALTEQGGTIHCTAEGVIAPCIDTAAFDTTK